MPLPANPTIGAVARVRAETVPNRGRQADEVRAARLEAELSGNSVPAEAMRNVTPDDDNDLPDGACRAILVGGAGTVIVTDLTGTDVTLVVGGGQIVPGWVARVKATGTTATNVVAMY